MYMTTIDSFNRPELNVQPLREQIAAWLRTAIFKGIYKQGQELRQEQLASELNVSRMPVREALQILEKEGLLELRPHRGALVKPIDASFIMETYDIRIMLEGEAAYLATPKLTKEDDAYLLSEHEQEAAAIAVSDVTALRILNREFHHFIWEKSGNSQLISLLQNKFESSHNFFYKPKMERNTYVPATFGAHKAVVNAMLAGDAAAARDAMRAHITISKNRTLKHFTDSQSPDDGERSLIPLNL